MSDSSSLYQAYSGNTYLFGGNAPYVEELYENYLSNPSSVPDTWREYFDALQHVPAVDGSQAKDVPHLPVVNAFAERAKMGGTKVVMASQDAEMGRKRTAAQQLIAAYRNVGVRWADLDPLKRTEREHIPELDPAFYGFADADQEAVFDTSNTFFLCLLRILVANFAQLVVLPEPCKPTKIITDGHDLRSIKSPLSCSNNCTSSSCTILITIWPGDILRRTSTPMALILTLAMKSLATGRATSASSRAIRISLIAASTSVSESTPLPFSFRKIF